MSRLHGLDIARFIAFCGMVLVNFRIVAATTPGSDWASLLTNALEGRAAALFVVLAGVGIVLGKPTRGLLGRRAAFLFVVGMINVTVFEADILHFYALYFVVAIFFLRAPNRGLWLGMGAILALGLASLVLLDYERGWNWDTFAYSDFWSLRGFLRHSFLNGWHPVLPWAAFVLFGMWIARLDLRRGSVQRGLLIWGAVAMVAAMVPVRLVQDPDLVDLFGTAPIPPGPFYMLSGAGSSAAVIGGLLMLTPLLDRLGLSPWLTAPGRQALTLYVAHILLGMGMLEALGLMDGSLTPAQILWISLGFCALGAAYARGWARWFRRGPLEALMRLTTEQRR